MKVGISANKELVNMRISNILQKKHNQAQQLYFIREDELNKWFNKNAYLRTLNFLREHQRQPWWNLRVINKFKTAEEVLH